MNCVVWDLFRTFLGPLGIFFPLGLFLGLRSGSNTFLEPSNVDYQFWFWKYNPTFLFLTLPYFGPFCIFLGLDHVKKTCLEPTNVDYKF